jgi:copper chaperone CopZ
LHEVASQLENQPGVDHVDVNTSTGSVLVHYDHTVHEKEDIVGCLEDVGLLLGSVLGAGGDELPDLGDSGNGEQGHSTTAKSVVDTVNDLDRRLSELTGRRVDLKLLFPLALGAIGLRSAIVNGIGLSEVPAYILLWYAFDSFWKFHQRPASTPGPADNTQDLADSA